MKQKKLKLNYTKDNMNKLSKAAAWLLAVPLLSGCAAVNDHVIKVRQTKTSTVIGCAPNDIAIDITTPETWTATCRQKVFYCKIVPGVLETTAACTPKME